MLAVDVFKQTLYVVFLLYCAGVVNVPFPEAWRIRGSSQSLYLFIRHKPRATHLHAPVEVGGGHTNVTCSYKSALPSSESD